ncbi:MAG: type II secretion system F family protein [SAR324 cluster bacterium]|nr:type II secretion system F family protein [SAR324 cluster bacterium]
MPLYQYRAFGAQNKVHRGTYDAASENEVRQYLRSSNLYPVEIKLSRFSDKKKIRDLSQGSEKSFDWQKILPFGKNHHKNVSVFTRQLQTLLEVTIPYDKALEMIIAQTEDPAFKSTLSEIRGKVVEGGHLAEAMESYPEIFPPMYVSMVRSGESSGTLGLIMNRLANFYENQEKLRSKLKSAMIYPIFMLLFSFAVITFMMLYIVPKITAVFETRDAILPLPTRLLISISDFLAEQWFLAFSALLLVIAGMTYFLKTPMGMRIKDKLSISLPLLKVLVIKVLVLRFCQTLGTLLKSGVDLKRSLEISKHVVVNHYFLMKLNQLIVDVNNKGIPLSAAMRRVSYFPEYVCHVVAIGEQAAQVDELLEKVADQMEMEVANTMEGLTSLLQPVMILLMGGIVGFIAVAILLPMLNMNQLL